MKYLYISSILVAILFVDIAKISDSNVINVLPLNEDKILIGQASYYDYTVNGWSSVGHRVCATRDFIRGSSIEVANINNGKVVICKVTDYGPDESIFPERIVDLSSTAFSDIADKNIGVISVSIKQLNY